MKKRKHKNKRDLKKEKKIALITLLAMIVIGLTCYFVYINNIGKPITNEKFKKIMEKEGLVVYDVKDQFDKDYIIDASVAYNNKTKYQIEFIVFEDIDNAKLAFNLNKDDFLNNKNEEAIEESISNEKISEYTLTTNDKYMYVSRRKNTLVYLTVDGSYKKEVENLIDKMGY